VTASAVTIPGSQTAGRRQVHMRERDSIGGSCGIVGGQGTVPTLTNANSDRAPRVYGPYSQAIAVDHLVYTAGQLPLDPATMEIVPGGIEEQGTQVLANLRAVLQAADSDLDRVIKTTLFLVDLADFEALNAVYARAFGEHKPVRSTVAVAGLPRGARVEIDAIAFR
jgi:2-iminobutanoate/2-iminopropanoate deaminase